LLCPLLLSEYKYPGKVSVHLDNNFYLERLTETTKKTLEGDKGAKATELTLPKSYKQVVEKKTNESYSSPWREYECVDGNHKLFMFSN
jgi:hypothetical protein